MLQDLIYISATLSSVSECPESSSGRLSIKAVTMHAMGVGRPSATASAGVAPSGRRRGFADGVTCFTATVLLFAVGRRRSSRARGAQCDPRRVHSPHNSRHAVFIYSIYLITLYSPYILFSQCPNERPLLRCPVQPAMRTPSKLMTPEGNALLRSREEDLDRNLQR